MSTDTTESLTTRPELDDERPAPRGRGTYRLHWSGVRTVIMLDVRRVLGDPRSLIGIGMWSLLFLGLAALANQAIEVLTDDSRDVGGSMFGAIATALLLIGSLVAPFLAGASVNTDRASGVLETLQGTRVSAIDVAVGKALGAWILLLPLLVGSVPAMIWAGVHTGTSVRAWLTVVGVIMLSLLMVCAVGVGWSALVPHVAAAMMLTYTTVVLIGFGLPALYALTLPMTTRTDTVVISRPIYADDQQVGCVDSLEQIERVHPEKTWWLLAPHPFVIASDASPVDGAARSPLELIRLEVRDLRLPPDSRINECQGVSDEQIRKRAQLRNGLPAAWPLGLFLDGVASLLFLQIAVEALESPSRRIPRTRWAG